MLEPSPHFAAKGVLDVRVVKEQLEACPRRAVRTGECLAGLDRHDSPMTASIAASAAPLTAPLSRTTAGKNSETNQSAKAASIKRSALNLNG
jgi:hypothetical protein